MNKDEVNALFDVTGKVALITGATGGFGKAASLGLAASGVRIMATGRSPESLKPLVAEIEAAGGTWPSLPGLPRTLSLWPKLLPTHKKLLAA